MDETVNTRARFLGVEFDLESKDSALSRLSRRQASDRFAYVVTPNVDHVVRLSRRPELAPAYAGAWMSWCDSHVIRSLARPFGLALPHMNGTDVMMRLFAEVLRPGDRLAVIGATDELLGAMRQRFPAFEVVGHVPPFGFTERPADLEAAARFGAASGGRFLFIGVGSPQSELLAAAIAARPEARGTAFCIGAALEFITDRKARAPQWLQDRGLEWLFRLASEPGRLWRRYLGGVLPLAVLVLAELRARRG